VRSEKRYLLLGIAATLTPVGIVVAPVASADCTSAGAATVCAQGTVTGGGPDAPQAGPAYPGYCADPWYCSDDWGVDIVVDPGPPGIDIGRPGRPGGGGPRR
jgi:hypothetical protein